MADFILLCLWNPYCAYYMDGKLCCPWNVPLSHWANTALQLAPNLNRCAMGITPKLQSMIATNISATSPPRKWAVYAMKCASFVALETRERSVWHSGYWNKCCFHNSTKATGSKMSICSVFAANTFSHVVSTYKRAKRSSHWPFVTKLEQQGLGLEL